MKWRTPHHRIVIISLIVFVLSCGCDKSVGVAEESEDDQKPVPAGLQVISGDEQKALIGTSLGELLVVKVVDQNEEPVPDISVRWSVTTGDGSVAPRETTTDISGLVRAEWTLGPEEGTNRIRAEAENLKPVVFIATGFERALSINCQPDVLDLPQNASGTFVCELTKNLEIDGMVSLQIFTKSEIINSNIQPDQVEVTAIDTAAFLIGVSEEGATSLGMQTVNITATNGEHEVFAGLQLEVVSSRPTVKIVYIVPTNRTNRSDYLNAMELATRHLQLWVHGEMANGKTFNLTNPIVQVIHTTHSAEWYSTNPLDLDKGLWFWYNVVNDGFSLTGGNFNDQEHIWIFFIEAEPACGQLGGAGTASVAVLPANDPRGLVGEQMIPYCPDEPLDNRPPCGWVGGFGHELGHAFGLPHPPGCDQGSSSCDAPALMWGGFRDYPDTYLRLDERDQLENTPFFDNLSVSAKNFSCNDFGGLGSANR